MSAAHELDSVLVAKRPEALGVLRAEVLHVAPLVDRRSRTAGMTCVMMIAWRAAPRCSVSVASTSRACSANDRSYSGSCRQGVVVRGSQAKIAVLPDQCGTAASLVKCPATPSGIRIRRRVDVVAAVSNLFGLVDGEGLALEHRNHKRRHSARMT